jgi:hypothetical protein
MNVRGNFSDFFDTTMLPAMDAKIDEGIKQKPPMFNVILREDSTTRSIKQYSGVTGVGPLRLVNEGADTDTDTIVQLFDKTMRPAKYGLGVAATRELVDDDQFGVISDRAEALGLSVSQTMEIQAASVLNNAFDATNYAGPDGVALCSASHLLVKGGGLQSNILAVAADLDVTSLEQALTDWETIKTQEGFFQSLGTPRLLAAPANRWNGIEILRSDRRSDTANNATNAFKYTENGGVPDLLIWAQLTDPDAWFLVAPPKQTQLVWLWRKKPYTTRDYNEKNETGVVYKRYRADFGFYGWKGVYGTPGA